MKRRKHKAKSLFIFLVVLLLAPAASRFSHAESDDDMKKYFEMSLEELMQVKVVTAARVPEKIAEIPAGVVLITGKDIETYGYATLTEILENIPGLYNIDDYTEFGPNFGVRGFWSGINNDNIIILVNGVPQVYNISSNYPLSGILVPVEAIERIEVIRGPMSVIYGSGAFFGVINIITNTVFDRESEKKWKRLPRKESRAGGGASPGTNAPVFPARPYLLGHGAFL